jgi:hypothetical protein
MLETTITVRKDSILNSKKLTFQDAVFLRNNYNEFNWLLNDWYIDQGGCELHSESVRQGKPHSMIDVFVEEYNQGKIEIPDLGY